MDTLISLDLAPGMRRQGTVYQAKSQWYTGNLVRFFQDTIQPIGGWEARSLSGAAISGVPRACVTYRRNDDTQVVVVGTTRGLYAIISNVVYDITPAAIVSNNVTRVWQLDVFGNYLVAVDLLAPRTAGGMYYWTGDTTVVAAIVQPFTGITPTSALSVVATPERFLVAIGGLESASGWSLTGQPSRGRQVTWATQEGGFTSSDWIDAVTNTAGDFTLTTEGSLMCGRRSRGMTLLWTTTDLWAMQYIGGVLVYRFEQLGNHCGVIATNAVVVTDTAAYWMGTNGFYQHDGFTKPIPCAVYDYVFGDMNRTYEHLIWALENPTFGEVTWWYVSSDATEIDRYVTYNYRENHWATGNLSRTCGITAQPGTTVFPVMFDASAGMWNHETGYARNGEGTPSIESGPVEMGNGDHLVSIQKVLPDDTTVGDVTMTFYTAPNPDTAEAVSGPYSLTPLTSVRVTARQIRVKLTEAVATGWRVGKMRFGVLTSSRR